MLLNLRNRNLGKQSVSSLIFVDAEPEVLEIIANPQKKKEDVDTEEEPEKDATPTKKPKAKKKQKRRRRY